MPGATHGVGRGGGGVQGQEVTGKASIVCMCGLVTVTAL